eukprot:6588508-Pyramimonas_sp.AAC.1
MFGTVEFDDVLYPRAVAMAPRGSVAPSQPGGEDPCGSDQLVERSRTIGIESDSESATSYVSWIDQRYMMGEDMELD